MKFFNKMIGFMAVLCVIPATYAVTARTGVRGATAGRLSTTRLSTATISGLSTTTSTTSSSLLGNKDCIDTYTECIKDSDVCGENFEECTTKILFHGKMANCLGTLSQCSSSGINSLFGTSATTSLNNPVSVNSDGEVTDYTYPTDGSVLGQFIIGAKIANQYDTSTCVKRMTSCLKKDSVCGSDFELCTTNKEFKKQRVYCDSTLARCQSDGLRELFGGTDSGSKNAPKASSRIGEMIDEGAKLAAVNSVSTCYKVTDQCILNACAQNPLRCIEGASTTAVDIAEQTVSSSQETASGTDSTNSTLSRSDVNTYLKNSCLATIGANKYCYATHDALAGGSGSMPSASQLADPDNQEEVFDDLYSARIDSLKPQLQDLLNKFDTKAKEKCTDTISTCAMRVCGGGVGAACYSKVFGSGDKSINKSSVYSDIKTGCEAIVNTNSYCQYASANLQTAGAYTYSYSSSNAFERLFPEYGSTTANSTSDDDPIEVVASLNARLATSYSDAAIAQMKKQCQSVATNCVKTMCGNDFENCYRNRTDMYSDLTNTGNSSYDKSMNKVGGVLDYTIVLGLCSETVKNSKVCEEQLAIEKAKVSTGESSLSSWGDATSVRTGWYDAGSSLEVSTVDAGVQAKDDSGNLLCTNSAGTQCVCNTVDASGNVCDTPLMISEDTYKTEQAVFTLFADLLYDVEKQAQAKYNAKLTKEQNACLSANSGGVMGKNDMGSTYQWSKLTTNKVPSDYAINGLASNKTVASNDLYGSFCRMRVTLQSSDKKIQEAITAGKSWSTAYFAVGDSFTCGSWIPESDLTKIADKVATNATEDKEKSQQRLRKWATVLGTVGFGAGGVALGEKIRKGKILGDLTGIEDADEEKEDYFGKCATFATTASSASDLATAESSAQSAISMARNGLKNLKTSNKENYKDVQDAVENLQKAMNKTYEDQTQITQEREITIKTAEEVKQEQTKFSQDNLPATLKDTCEMVKNTEGYSTESTTYKSICNNIKDKPALSNDEINTWSAAAEKEMQTENQSGQGPKYRTAQMFQRDFKYFNQVAAIKPEAFTKKVAGETKVISSATEEKLKAIKGEALKLSDACSGASIKDSQQANEEKKNRNWITWTSAGVSAVAGGILVNRLVNDIQQTKLDEEQKAAYDEWMNNVGSKIQCYIGGDEVGNYGDLIQTSVN